MIEKPWFRKKTYGYGWGLPITWQGWLVFGVYIVLIMLDALQFGSYPSLLGIFLFSIQIVYTTILLITICYLAGGKPEWRWGKKHK